jgi:PKD repeat protein
MAEINILGSLTSGNQAPDGVIDSPATNQTITVGQSVSFAGTGTDPNNNTPLTYLWNFGTGSGIANSTVEDPGLKQFNTEGVFTVSFTVTDALGLTDPTPATRVITVQEIELIPDWTNVTYDPFDLVTPTTVTNPVLLANNITDISAKFVADSFLFYENNTWYLFNEILNNSGNQGDLGVSTSTDGLHWTYQQIVLNESWHLSYPYVFKYNGIYYMIPETHAINEIRIYRATNFPYTWSYNATLVSGRDFSDSSIFRYNGKWWIFASDSSHSNCYLYYSSNLTSGWVQHSMSPIVAGDASKARPGGRAFVFDTNRIIRTVQKDDVVYGEKVRIFEADTLTEATYVEHEVPESPILQQNGTGWSASGMHQFDPWWTGNHWLCAVDGHNGPSWWSAGIYIAPHPSAPNSVIDSPVSDMTISQGSSVVFNGTGSDPDGNLPLSYRWKFGVGSGISDSTQQDPGTKQFNTPGTYQVTFTVTDAQGIYDPTPAVRTISVLSGSSVIPKAGWSLQFVDSEETVAPGGYGAVKAFDGDINTYWHTRYYNVPDPPLPHEIQINLGAVYDVSGFRYLPRQGTSQNGRIRDWEFYVSTNPSSWGSPVATGAFTNDATEKEVLFSAKTGQYIRLRAHSEVNGNPSWTTMAEINVLGN